LGALDLRSKRVRQVLQLLAGICGGRIHCRADQLEERVAKRHGSAASYRRSRSPRLGLRSWNWFSAHPNSPVPALDGGSGALLEEGRAADLGEHGLEGLDDGGVELLARHVVDLAQRLIVGHP